MILARTFKGHNGSLGGFYCLTCGEQHIFGSYAAAHWDDLLVHVCPFCGAEHSLRSGVVRLTKEGHAKKKEKRLHR